MRANLTEQLGSAAVNWRKQMQRHRYRNKEVIFQQGELGDTLHLIDKGSVLVEVFVAFGDVAALSIRWPGEIIGEIAIVGDGRRTARVTALEPTETLAISEKSLGALRSQDPNVDRLFLKALATKLEQSTEQHVDMLFASVEIRVWRVLLRLAAMFDRGICPLVIKVRQQDIAAMAGSSRQSVNRALRRAESAGVLALKRGQIAIFDLGRLRNLAR
ncbi:MAG: Crp/Fnr family transcriptional regulator [Acidimicrobiia bacterium]|nr:Crp/Fnr family transcriptional regulator [Acidimicrobiia bacterium]MCY4458394.1 Crp/Fnr family transcriptional regulator [Acidimicrobiaceae bacterium]